MTAPAQPRRPFLQDSIIWERKGPLPVWGWAALILGFALVYAWWKRKRAQSAQSNVTTGYDTVPGNQQPPPIFLVPVVSPAQDRHPTPNDMPKRRPGVGGDRPPRPGPVDRTPPVTPPGGGAPPPVTPPPSPVVVIPDTVTAPANTNLYNWSQGIEQQYGLTSPVFDKARTAGPLKWMPAGWGGADPAYGNVPIFTQPTQVRIR